MPHKPNHAEKKDFMTILLFILGLVLLIAGAEALVRGASRLAIAVGISPLIVGLTVVAFGTSSPEFAVSIKAALSGQSAIAIGNIIGSCIANILLILGLSALITPLVVSQHLIRLDVPILIVASCVVWFFSFNGVFGLLEGLILFGSLIIYVTFLIYQSRKETEEVQEEYNREFGPKNGLNGWPKNLLLVVVGLVMLVQGSRWLVDGAVAFAQYLGVSELIIGLTVIAVGTSLPEIVTSVIASLRGERDIAVGNAIGSNIFNILGVLGLTAIITPGGIAVSPSMIAFDIPIMVAVSFACLPIFFTGGVISRAEGVVLLAYYLAYTLYLILAANQHDALVPFSAIMLYFVIPLTALTLFVVTLQAVRKRSAATVA
jgi:cation:H+ antiporter